MKRFLLLSLTGINFLTLLFLSAAHASPELRDIPQTGGKDGEILPAFPANTANTHDDSLGIDPAGEYEIVWNADAFSSGVYFARLVTPEGAFSQKLVVVK